MEIVCPGVARVPTGFVNVYFIGEPDGSWALVDTGLPGYAATIIEEAERRFGARSRPAGIFLTHGHTDHVGNAQRLADYWGVHIHAHRLELPYLTGISPYPLPDPTIGGPMALLSRLMPATVRDLGSRMRAFTPLDDGPFESGELSGIAGWRWIFTPGHAPGHVAFYRESDRTLLAGDAVATVNMSSFVALFTKPNEIAMAGAPVISDWDVAEESVRRLAALHPQTLACGHGEPMVGPGVAAVFDRFAQSSVRPERGRYVGEPARTDEHGIVSLPPKPADHLPWIVLAILAGFGLAWALIPKRKK